MPQACHAAGSAPGGAAWLGSPASAALVLRDRRGSRHMAETFEHPVAVRWRDVDALGHVNHAIFLTYLEEGRDAFYTATVGRDPHYVVVRIEIDLRAEIGLEPRQVTVRIEVERLGTTSLTT